MAPGAGVRVPSFAPVCRVKAEVKARSKRDTLASGDNREALPSGIALCKLINGLDRVQLQ